MSTQNLALPVSLTEALADKSVLLGVALALVNKADLTRLEGLAVTGISCSRDKFLIDEVRAAVRAGHDPLGVAYCTLNTPLQRRGRGQTFTPEHVITGMTAWIKRQKKQVARVVDPGAGSGRYTLAALRTFPDAQAVAVELDPVVAVILRANLAAAGLGARARVVVDDFRNLELARIDGVTAWLGNPPYVRHHGINPEWKRWYSATLARFGHEGSQLAGLHLHFFLKTLELASEGDIGCYVTAAEWLDVKYGQALRQLLTNGLGGKEVFVVEPTVQVFEDAMVSAAITCFAPGSKGASLRFARIFSEPELRKLASGHAVALPDAKAELKWSFLVKGGRLDRPEGYIELGEFFKVSRGQVTGSNRVWVAGGETPPLPSRFLVPAITNSAEITRAAMHVIDKSMPLKHVVCLPHDLDILSPADQAAVERFLEWARSLGADKSYVATHRQSWWTVEFKSPAPVVMTYMGRRPPVFALNRAKAPFINVAHGLYPRKPVPEKKLEQLVQWLNTNVTQEHGRVYAGGLTKFEPSEAMRILIPESLAP